MIKTAEKLEYVVGIGETECDAITSAVNNYNAADSRTFLKMEFLTRTTSLWFRVIILFTEKVQTECV
jgi:hypothetical protein